MAAPVTVIGHRPCSAFYVGSLQAHFVLLSGGQAATALSFPRMAAKNLLKIRVWRFPVTLSEGIVTLYRVTASRLWWYVKNCPSGHQVFSIQLLMIPINPKIGILQGIYGSAFRRQMPLSFDCREAESASCAHLLLMMIALSSGHFVLNPNAADKVPGEDSICKIATT